MTANSQSPPVIVCRNLTLGYGGEAVLRNIHLEIPGGIFLPIIGPNGAGKTTLLKAFLGLIKPMGGSIRTPLSRNPAGYVPQHKSVDPLIPLRTFEIVAMGLYPRLGWWKKPDSGQRREIQEALKEFRLEAHAGKLYRELSGGTKQKVLIARAFLSRAEIFIMDEPASDLDKEAQREVFTHLDALVIKHQRTVLMAHHGPLSGMKAAPASACFVGQGQAVIRPLASAQEGE